jgi:hypothetical protein
MKERLEQILVADPSEVLAQVHDFAESF